MTNDKKLAQLVKWIPAILYKALLLVFLALYFDHKRSKIKAEPKIGIRDLWGDNDLICHFPYWTSFRYSYVKDNYHYILRPKRIPNAFSVLTSKLNHDIRVDYYGLSFHLPEYIAFPYPGPDDPFPLPKVDQDQLLIDENVRVKRKWKLKIA